MYSQKEWIRKIRERVGKEADKAGCRIDLEFEYKLSGPAGRIVYHNPDTWTVIINRHVFGRSFLPFSGGKKRELICRYIYYYLGEQISMDTLCMRQTPSSYLQGLAMLCHIQKREAGRRVFLRFPRHLLKGYRTGGESWMADDLYCDLAALKKTLDFGRQNGYDPDILSHLKSLGQEAAFFCDQPEICYSKKGLPRSLVPCIKSVWQDLPDCGRRYPGLGSIFEEGLCARAALKTGGDFGNELALHLLVLCRDEGVSIRQVSETAQKYLNKSVSYVLSMGESPSKLLTDNRIAVEGVAGRITERMRKEGLQPEAGLHSQGYY